MITEYKVISLSNIETFQKEINRRMNYGWKPLGGLSVVVMAGNYEVYHQAMIRKVDSHTNEAA
jgi:hypothetical protein